MSQAARMTTKEQLLYLLDAMETASEITLSLWRTVRSNKPSVARSETGDVRDFAMAIYLDACMDNAIRQQQLLDQLRAKVQSLLASEEIY